MKGSLQDQYGQEEQLQKPKLSLSHMGMCCFRETAPHLPYCIFPADGVRWTARVALFTLKDIIFQVRIPKLEEWKTLVLRAYKLFAKCSEEIMYI